MEAFAGPVFSSITIATHLIWPSRNITVCEAILSYILELAVLAAVLSSHTMSSNGGLMIIRKELFVTVFKGLRGETKMKCPFCGSEEGYYEIEKVHRALYYTFDGEPNGASEDYNDWASRRKYSAKCNRILPRKMFGYAN